MGGLLADNPGFWSVFGSLFVLLLGAAGAWATGRAMAGTWRPIAALPFALLVLAAGVRFLRYAIFGEDLLSPYRYVLALAIVVVAAAYGYRSRRVEQMTRQYPWLFAKAGTFGWVGKDGA